MRNSRSRSRLAYVSALAMAASFLSIGSASAEQLAAGSGPTQPVELSTIIANGGTPLQQGVTYRIDRIDQQAEPEFFQVSKSSTKLELPHGQYRVTTEYGATKMEQNIVVGANNTKHVMNLNAGIIKLRMIPDINAKPLTSDTDWQILTYGKDAQGNRQEVHRVVSPDPELVLPAGWYVVQAYNGNTMTKHTIEVTAGISYKYTLVKKKN